jgi:hypothetical protein
MKNALLTVAVVAIGTLFVGKSAAELSSTSNNVVVTAI